MSNRYRPKPGDTCFCQLRGYGEWQIVKIICDYQACPESKIMLWATDGARGEHCFTIHPHANFRPLKTPEQIAAEERQKALEEMVYGAIGADRDGSNGSNTTAFILCGLLYDAGYRKVTP